MLENQTLKSESTCPNCGNKTEIKILTTNYTYPKDTYGMDILITISFAIMAGLTAVLCLLDLSNSIEILLYILLAITMLSLFIGIFIKIIKPCKNYPMIIYICPACNKTWTKIIPESDLPKIEE